MRADQAILEAEKFKAIVANPPTGNDTVTSMVLLPNKAISCGQNVNQQLGHINFDQNLTHSMGQTQTQMQTISNIGTGLSDDDFFHLTCFIEPTLIHKIEKGEFVELEKLLPKDRHSGNVNIDEGRLEWVQREGGTF